MRNAVIVLNGASSSGKSSIALELRGLLPRPFLAFGVDTLVAALPPASSTHEPGIVFGSDGVVAVGDRFRQLEHVFERKQTRANIEHVQAVSGRSAFRRYSLAAPASDAAQVAWSL